LDHLEKFGATFSIPSSFSLSLVFFFPPNFMMLHQL
jgi:hypothetical protein